VPSVAKYVVVLAVLAGIAYLTMPLWTYAYGAVVDRVKNVETATPSSFRASSFAPGHRPGLVNDTSANRFWAPDTRGPAKGAYVQARFSKPIRLVYLDIQTGVGTKPDRFRRHGRPTGLRVTALSRSGDKVTKTFDLKDDPDVQRKTLRASDVVRVTFTITSSKLGTAPATRVAIGEITFKRRK
jgi:hypothetical protein